MCSTQDGLDYNMYFPGFHNMQYTRWCGVYVFPRCLKIFMEKGCLPPATLLSGLFEWLNPYEGSNIKVIPVIWPCDSAELLWYHANCQDRPTPFHCCSHLNK